MKYRDFAVFYCIAMNDLFFSQNCLTGLINLAWSLEISSPKIGQKVEK